MTDASGNGTSAVQTRVPPRMKEREAHGEMVKVRVCKRADCGEEIDR